MKKISAETRTPKKEAPESIREEGQIPCILYGPKTKPVSLKVNQKDFKKVFKEIGETTLVNLEFDDEERKVLIHDLQKHPVSDNIIHIDFYEPSLTEKTTAQVPLTFVGKSTAVEDEAGTLIKAVDEIEVEALPENLPREIEVDISKLETFSDHIYVEDLKIPDGVEVKREKDTIIASVQPPEDVEEELERLEEETIEEQVEEVETEKEGEEEEIIEEEDGELKEKEEKEEKEEK